MSCILIDVTCRQQWVLVLGIHPQDYWMINVLQKSLSVSLNWSLLICKASTKKDLVFKHWPHPLGDKRRRWGLVCRSRPPKLSLSQPGNLVHSCRLGRFQFPLPEEEGLWSLRSLSFWNSDSLASEERRSAAPCCSLIFLLEAKEKARPAHKWLTQILSSDPVAWGPEKMHTHVLDGPRPWLVYEEWPLQSQLSKQQRFPWEA